MESQPSPRKLIEKIVSRRPLSRPPHAVDGDFYKIAHLVGEADQALLGRVRAFAEEKVAPNINQY